MTPYLSQLLAVCFISMCSLDGDNYMYMADGYSPLLLVNKNISNAGFYDNVVCYNCDYTEGVHLPFCTLQLLSSVYIVAPNKLRPHILVVGVNLRHLRYLRYAPEVEISTVCSRHPYAEHINLFMFTLDILYNHHLLYE